MGNFSSKLLISRRSGIGRTRRFYKMYKQVEKVYAEKDEETKTINRSISHYCCVAGGDNRWSHSSCLCGGRDDL